MMKYFNSSGKSVFFAICFLTLLISKSQSQDKTEILILGTAHLSQIKGFDPNMLSGVLDRLDEYNFDAIGIENMSTELLYDIKSRKDSTYYDLLESFGGSRIELADTYQKLLNVTLVEAKSKITELLNLSTLSVENRLNLIQYFFAAGDLASATLQYQYIKGLSDFDSTLLEGETIVKLEKLSSLSNETYSIAVKVAQKEKLQKLEYIDNFQDEALLLSHFPEFIPDYLKDRSTFDEISNLPVYQKIDSIQTSSIKEGDILPLLEFYNNDYYQTADYEAQWEIWLKTNFPSKADRSRYALWEMRNLQIAANIMKTVAFYPNQKILIIIGASHKSFLEKYLSQSPNINLLKLD